MNGPIDEVRRLRGELAERDRQLAELRGLVQAHIEATSDDHDYDLQRERAAYEHGRDEPRTYEDGFALGHDTGMSAQQEARPYVHGVMDGWEAGVKERQVLAQELLGGKVRELRPKERETEREAG
jgi:flagellar biosynthesis/type III secretory pathway protein FliH